MKHITSRDNPLLKTIVKLNDSAKERAQLQQTVLDGIHLLQAYAQKNGKLERVVVSETAYQHKEISTFLHNHTIDHIFVVPDELFDKVSPVKSPTGILAVIDIPAVSKIPEKLSFCLLLEDIQDAGNVGSILRSAAAAGVKQVFLSQSCADVWSPKTLRAAMGAQFFLAIHESIKLMDIIKRFKGKVIATSPHVSISLDQTDLTGPVAFVVGNEGAGLSQQMLDQATDVVKIVMPGEMESLNVAAATAVCLFEKVRQDQASS